MVQRDTDDRRSKGIFKLMFSHFLVIQGDQAFYFRRTNIGSHRVPSVSRLKEYTFGYYSPDFSTSLQPAEALK